jgi:hypothetical protein
MAYEQKDNSGSLFRNDKREKDTHPHATGKAMIGGVMYYVSAWTKEGSKGRFQSLSFKPVDGGATSGASRAASGSQDDGEYPF